MFHTLQERNTFGIPIIGMRRHNRSGLPGAAVANIRHFKRAVPANDPLIVFKNLYVYKFGMSNRQLFDHTRQTETSRINTPSRHVVIGCLVEKDIQGRVESFFNAPVGNHDRYFRKRVNHYGNIGFKLIFNLSTAENMYQILEKVRVRVGKSAS